MSPVRRPIATIRVLPLAAAPLPAAADAATDDLAPAAEIDAAVHNSDGAAIPPLGLSTYLHVCLLFNVTQMKSSQQGQVSRLSCRRIKTVLAEPEVSRRRLYVLYDGGTEPGTVRSVLPLRWIKEPTSLAVLCFKDEASPMEKSYFVARMRQVMTEYPTNQAEN